MQVDAPLFAALTGNGSRAFRSHNPQALNPRSSTPHLILR